MGREATGTVEWRGSPARWFARITVTKEGGGLARPWVDLERPDLKNTPADKKIAKRLARKRASAAKGGVYVGPEQARAELGLSLAEYEERWFSLIERDPKLATKTVDRYKSSWTQLVSHFAAAPVTEITPLTVRQWVWKRQAERSASTVRNDCIAMSRFFQDAIAEKWISITANPMHDRIVRDAKPEATHHDPDDIVRFTHGQVESLLAAEGMPDEDFGVLLFAILSGGRGGEVRGVQFKFLRDPRDNRACIRIVQQVVKETVDQPLHVADPKRGSKRQNPMQSQLATWLEWWRAEGWERFVGRKPTDEDFVFPDEHGDICRPRDADTLRRWAKKGGVPTEFVRQDGSKANFTMNALRRTFASLLGDAEVDGGLIDELLGHKAKSVRGQHYQGTWFERKVRAVARLQFALPVRNGVAPAVALPPDNVPESSQAEVMQLTGTDDSVEVSPRKREVSWCCPRFSKPV